jgi:hypothetical protein
MSIQPRQRNQVHHEVQRMDGVQNYCMGSATHYAYVEVRPAGTKSANSSVALDRFKTIRQESFLAADTGVGGAAIKKSRGTRRGVCDADHIY